MYVSLELNDLITLVRQTAAETDFRLRSQVDHLRNLVGTLSYEMSEAEKPAEGGN